MIKLSYGDDDFAVRARKLVSSGQALSFDIADEAYRQLLPLLVEGRIADPAKLGLRPKLQPLLGILMLAQGLERIVILEQRNDSVVVQIGTGSA